jgi:radical SAM protein with 4Fe4S-binding SPASM domain
MRDFIRAQVLETLPRARLEQAFAAARDAALRAGINLRLSPLANANGKPRAAPRCDWPWRGAYVSYRGEAMPCCMVGTPDRVNFGNMLDEGVGHVWRGEAYQRFRTQLAADEPSPICRSCSLYRGVF